MSNNNGGLWLLALPVVALLMAGGSVVYRNYKQRGIRNNNPGNLVRTNLAWKGKVPHSRSTDSRFEQFEDYQGVPGHIWGLRAMFLDLRGDVLKDGKDTITKLVTEYAPKFENNTAAYIARVATEMGMSKDAKLTAGHVPLLLAPMTRVENGIQPYPLEDFKRAVSLA